MCTFACIITCSLEQRVPYCLPGAVAQKHHFLIWYFRSLCSSRQKPSRTRQVYKGGKRCKALKDFLVKQHPDYKEDDRFHFLHCFEAQTG